VRALPLSRFCPLFEIDGHHTYGVEEGDEASVILVLCVIKVGTSLPFNTFVYDHRFL
jgi:hypothetical protein